MTPEWYEIALAEIGTAEKRGGENPRILEYHATTTLKAREDEVPWCASFVNWCLKEAGIKGTNSAAARSWLTWGRKLEHPLYGCVTVIRQRKKGADAATGSASGYHVAFLDRITTERIYLLGGNQSDQVKVSGFGLRSYEICGYRWPENVEV